MPFYIVWFNKSRHEKFPWRLAELSVLGPNPLGPDVQFQVPEFGVEDLWINVPCRTYLNKGQGSFGRLPGPDGILIVEGQLEIVDNIGRINAGPSTHLV